MATFRMILIDPETETITEHQVSSAIKIMGEMIGTMDIDTARIAQHDQSYDYIMVDDTGLKRGEPIHAFQFLGRPDPIAGKCLIYGATKHTGETCDARFDLGTLSRVVRFLGLIVPKVEWSKDGNVDSAAVSWSKVQ